MSVDKRCSICANAYGTRYICSKCRQGIITYKDKDGTTKTWQNPTLAKEWSETSRNADGVREVVPNLPISCDALGAYRDTDRPAVFGGKAHVFTQAERGVADGILHGETDAQIARKTGLSMRHVRRLRKWFTTEGK